MQKFEKNIVDAEVYLDEQIEALVRLVDRVMRKKPQSDKKVEAVVAGD